MVLLKDTNPGEYLVSELHDFIIRENYRRGDVELCCRDREIVKAHSAMLAIASPFLRQLLNELCDPYHGALILLPDFRYENKIISIFLRKFLIL